MKLRKLMKRFLDELYDTLRSIKLASVLLVLLALMAVLGGVIPQGKNAFFYSQKFPGTEARLILSLHLDHVFTNPIFLALTALFTVNLTVCTFHRLSNELRKKSGTRRHGPDLLHIGLILLVFGGILTAKTRTETYLNLKKGDHVTLPNGTMFTLTGLEYSKYDDGRPKSWSSSVLVEKSGSDTTVKTITVDNKANVQQSVDGFDPNLGDGFGDNGFADPALKSMTGAAASPASVVSPSPASGVTKSPTTEKAAGTSSTINTAPTTTTGQPFTIRVNAPLKLSGYSIYQQNWSADRLATLTDAAGIQFHLAPGEKQTTNDGFVLFMAEGKTENPLGKMVPKESQPGSGAGSATGPQPGLPPDSMPGTQSSGRGIFLIDSKGTRKALQATQGQNVGPFVFQGFYEDPVSGLKIVRDSGYPFVVAGFVFILIGVFMTYVRKLKGILS
jgi:hypothetical protein